MWRVKGTPEGRMQLGAVHDHAGGGIVTHLLQRERRPDHVSRKVLSTCGVDGLHAHAVMHRETRVALGQQARSKLRGDELALYEQRKHRLAKGLRESGTG